MTSYLTFDDFCRIASRIAERDLEDVRGALACGGVERILLSPATVATRRETRQRSEAADRSELAVRTVELMRRVLLESPLFEHNKDLAWLCGLEFVERNGYRLSRGISVKDMNSFFAGLRSTNLVLGLRWVESWLQPVTSEGLANAA